MGNAAGQLAKCLHTLGLNERGLGLLAADDLRFELARALRHAFFKLQVDAGEGGLVTLSLCYVANDNHEDAPPADVLLGDRCLGRKLAAVLAPRENFLPLPHPAGSNAGPGESGDVLVMCATEALGY